MIICKHCGSERGFYTLQRVHGLAEVHYTNKGDYAEDNGQMHEGIYYTGGKKAYCLSCTRFIGKSEDLISGMEEGDSE